MVDGTLRSKNISPSLLWTSYWGCMFPSLISVVVSVDVKHHVYLGYKLLVLGEMQWFVATAGV